MDENLMTTDEVTTDVESDVIGLDGYESSVEEPEVAEPVVSEDESAESTESNEGAEAQSIDVNAIAAAARRKAEADARNIQKSLDDEYVRRFGHLSNPITGKPIRSQADYLEALDAQEKLRTDEELKNKGIDPSIIDNAIANNPIVRNAQEVLEQNQRTLLMTQINSELAELKELDPTIESLENVPPNVLEMVQNSGGHINLVNAYKILNYGKVNVQKEEAIKQSAINQAKGKQHLNPVNGVASPDEGMEIPSTELKMWKEMFPDKSSAELKKLYNKTL